jgi:uncharacterized protein YqjF (DUF2071 family)
MTGVRPVWLPPLPFVSHFHETNLRTYVHTGGHDPGVWFFSLDATSMLAVAGARAMFGLPYHIARINMEIRQDGAADSPVIDYTLRRHQRGSAPAFCNVRYAPRGPVNPAEPGSLEFFLAERYVLYSVMGGRLYRGRIHHAPWPLQSAEVSGLEESMLTAAGISRGDQVPHCHYGKEVRVEVFGIERVTTDRAMRE